MILKKASSYEWLVTVSFSLYVIDSLKAAREGEETCFCLLRHLL